MLARVSPHVESAEVIELDVVYVPNKPMPELVETREPMRAQELVDGVSAGQFYAPAHKRVRCPGEGSYNEEGFVFPPLPPPMPTRSLARKDIGDGESGAFFPLFFFFFF
jgi:hypothetical protein